MAGVQELAAAEVVVPGDEKRGDELHGHGADFYQVLANRRAWIPRLSRVAGVQELAAAEVVVPGDEKRGDELHGHGADVQQADADEHVQVVHL